jgi:hypothetical protein
MAFTTHVLDDGCIRCCLEEDGFKSCCIVSSFHLVDSHINQLKAANARQAQQVIEEAS